MIRPRAAPRLRRRAISLRRPAARANNKLATFTQQIDKTKAEPANSAAKRGLHVAYGVGLHGGQCEPEIFGRVFGVRSADFLSYAVEIALRFGHGNAGLQARHQADVILFAVLIDVVIECIEDLHVGRYVRVGREVQLKIGRQGAYESILPIHRHALAEEMRIAGEAAPEEAVCQHDRRTTIVFLGEGASMGRVYAQQVEEIGCDAGALYLLGVVAGECTRQRPNSGDASEERLRRSISPRMAPDTGARAWPAVRKLLQTIASLSGWL